MHDKDTNTLQLIYEDIDNGYTFKWIYKNLAQGPNSELPLISTYDGASPMTKKDFFKIELESGKREYSESMPTYTEQVDDGTWKFTWEDGEGSYIGFIEDVDFEF